MFIYSISDVTMSKDVIITQLDNKQNCLFCNAQLAVSTRNCFNIFKTILFPLEKKACDLIGELIIHLILPLNTEVVHINFIFHFEYIKPLQFCRLISCQGQIWRKKFFCSHFFLVIKFFVGAVLDMQITENSLHSDVVCKKCFKLVNEFADLESRVSEIKLELTTNFKKTTEILQSLERTESGSSSLSGKIGTWNFFIIIFLNKYFVL